MKISNLESEKHQTIHQTIQTSNLFVKQLRPDFAPRLHPTCRKATRFWPAVTSRSVHPTNGSNNATVIIEYIIVIVYFILPFIYVYIAIN